MNIILIICITAMMNLFAQEHTFEQVQAEVPHLSRYVEHLECAKIAAFKNSIKKLSRDDQKKLLNSFSLHQHSNDKLLSVRMKASRDFFVYGTRANFLANAAFFFCVLPLICLKDSLCPDPLLETGVQLSVIGLTEAVLAVGKLCTDHSVRSIKSTFQELETLKKALNNPTETTTLI